MIKIEFAGSPEELSSPFTKEHKILCHTWGEYLKSKNGKLNAKYTAWAIKLKGSFQDQKQFSIEIEKMTMSSGNLLISSKKNKYEKTKIKIENFKEEANFRISKRTMLSQIRASFSNNFNVLSKDLVVKYNSEFNPSENSLINILVEQSTKLALSKVEYIMKRELLILEFNHLVSDVNLIERIIKRDFT